MVAEPDRPPLPDHHDAPTPPFFKNPSPSRERLGVRAPPPSPPSSPSPARGCRPSRPLPEGRGDPLAHHPHSSRRPSALLRMRISSQPHASRWRRYAFLEV